MTPERMKKIRHDAGLTLGDFAKLIGVSDKRTIRRWESGGQPISGPVTILLELIEADELPMRYYPTYDADPPSTP